jgi:hypothetical protein
MNDKLKRLARNITELLVNTDEPQDTYLSLVGLMNKQSDYFSLMAPENVLKLTFYCHSYAKTKSFDLADKMLDNIAFAVLFYNTGNTHKDSCDNCEGRGEIHCEDCYGAGNTECDECDGSGEVTCDSCDGDGREMGDNKWEPCSDCEGAGVLTCGECDGQGRTLCRNCQGGGESECYACDGDGEVETDEDEYIRYFIVTWDKYIKERCELTENDNNITMSEYEFDKLRDKYISLKIEEIADELAEWVEINEMYCTYYSDNPPLILQGMQLSTLADSITFYTTK